MHMALYKWSTFTFILPSFYDLILGAGREAVMASYKKLAQQWFPEKHQHSNESLNVNLKKFHLKFVHTPSFNI